MSAKAERGPMTPDDVYEMAVDALHEAARDFTKKWLKAPGDSSFNEWFEACAKLEQAAVEFAEAKRQNEQSTKTR